MKDSLIEGLLALLAISIIIFVIIIPKSIRLNLTGWPGLGPGPAGETTTGGSVYTNATNPNSNSTVTSGGVQTPLTTAPSGSIYISSGNASYETDPMSEYITIENQGNSPIDISGWRLQNNKSARAYPVGGNYVHYASDVGIIPQGAKVLSPSGASAVADIVLNPGDQAIVVSGGPGNISPYTLTSFKENECTGYLSETVNFPSGQQDSCVYPYNELGANNLDLQCQNFIKSMSSCHTPKYNSVDYNHQVCDGCVDGTAGLSSMCVAYIKAHYSYSGCLASHENDQNFEGRVWHVYLYRPWEMWASSNETIFLYDSSGKLVTSTSY